jgi:hypothetical protein
MGYAMTGAGALVPATGLFSTGEKLAGDGNQAGHWKDNVLAPDGLFRGIMDPTLADGFKLTEAFLTLLASPGGPSLDRMAFDVIGYDVPEPGSLSLFALGGLAMHRRRRATRAAAN